jgi:hypothetical protein
MNIDNLTIGQVKQVKRLLPEEGYNNQGGGNGPWVIGNKYFIQTVTMFYTGILSYVGDQELVLENAAWIADTGRLNKFLKDPEGSVKEAEPFEGPAGIGRGSIVGFSVISSIVTEVI